MEDNNERCGRLCRKGTSERGVEEGGEDAGVKRVILFAVDRKRVSTGDGRRETGKKETHDEEPKLCHWRRAGVLTRSKESPAPSPTSDPACDPLDDLEVDADPPAPPVALLPPALAALSDALLACSSFSVALARDGLGLNE